jgi:hypothetical protein
MPLLAQAVREAVEQVVNPTDLMFQILKRPTEQTTQAAVEVAVLGMVAFQTTPLVVAAVQVLL